MIWFFSILMAAVVMYMAMRKGAESPSKILAAIRIRIYR